MWSRLHDTIVSAYQFMRPGRPVSRKLIAATLTSAGTYVMTFALVKLGLHLNAWEASLVAVAVAQAAGFAAGWLRKEFPTIVADQ